MTRFFTFYAAIFLLLLTSPCMAGAPYLFKIASLAPEGSVWTNQFRAFAGEVAEKTNGEVTIKIYAGGVMGDDLAMYRKIRAGQLQGGGFTMTGIASVVPDFRIMAIPFYFRNYEEIDRVSDTLRPYFAQKFADNDLELIALTEVGFIYAMSTAPTITLADLQKGKSWIPSGDPVTATFLDNLGVTPIPLSIPDVLSSLQTGLIDTVYTSLYGAIVMQWFTKAVYITDVPYGYAYGAIALSKKAFAALPAAYAELIHQTADKHFTALNAITRKNNNESRAVLEKYGVTFVETAAEILPILEKNRDETIVRLVGSSFSAEAYGKMTAVIDDIRSTGK